MAYFYPDEGKLWKVVKEEVKRQGFYSRVGFRVVLPAQRGVRSCEVHALMPFADRLWVATGWGGAGLYEVDEDFTVKPRDEGVPGDNFGRAYHRELDVAVIGAHVVHPDRVRRHGVPPAYAFTYRDDRTLFAVGFDGRVEWLNPVTLEHSHVTDVPRGAYPAHIPRCRDAVFKAGRLYVACARQYPDYDVGLQYYDTATGAWVKVSDGVFHALWTDYEWGWGNPLYAFGHDELSALMLVTRDGARFSRYRLPKSRPDFDYSDSCQWRARRVASYSALAYVHGTFYEIPNFNFAGVKGMLGAVIVRPVSTTLWNIFDFAPFVGMLAVGRSELFPPEGNSVGGQPQSGLDMFRLEDLWSFGRPRGYGGMWKDTSVSAGEVSDPFLIHGFDVKTLHLWTDTPGTFTVEVDPVGDGTWKTYDTVTFSAAGYDKYIVTGDAVWLRVSFDRAARVGAWLNLR